MSNKAKQQKAKEGSLRGSKDLSSKPSFYCAFLGKSLNVSEHLLNLPMK